MSSRIAIISSPRSGNTWTRIILAQTLGMEQIAVHNWKELPAKLPERCVLQIHWYREPNFQCFLRENGFRVLVLARHPLDILLSVLHFIQYEPMTARWLEGFCAIPRELAGASPNSRDFARYGTSWGAENLLSISYQWWNDPETLKIRYEDLVRDPKSKFGEIVQSLSADPDGLATALRELNFEVLRSSPNRHGWQGRPGLWKLLVPTSTALRIYLRHQRIFSVLGYPPPVSIVTPGSAKRHWEKLRV